MKPHLSLSRRGRKKDSDKKKSRRIRLDLKRVSLAFATIIILSVVISIHILPDRLTLSPGDTAPEDVRAHMSVRYLQAADYERRQAEAASSVPNMYDAVPYAIDQSLHGLGLVFDTVNRAKSDATLKTADEKAAHARTELKDHLGIEVPLTSLKVLVSAPERIISDVRSVTARILREAMKSEIKDDDPVALKNAQMQIESAAREDLGETDYAKSAADVAKSVLRPNMTFNVERTAAARKAAIASVKPSYGYIRSGELIIAKGQVVTREHLEKLAALGFKTQGADFRTVISLVGLVAFLVVIVIIYLARYQPAIYSKNNLLALLALVVVVSALCLKLGGAMLGIKLSGLQLAYIGLVFTTAAGMTLAVLLNPQVAVLVVAMLSVLSGVVMNYELRYATSTLISGLVAIYSVANIRGRGDLVRAIAAIAVTNVALVWIMGGLFGDSVADMAFGSIWAVLVIAVPATAIIFWYGTWLLERIFNVTTHISLLELADTNKPILRRLVVEAPGTYTHSMVVGHLAEAAAEAIGADGLYAKVGAYYHDIGKIRRPHFFVENQQAENAHDRLNPSLSALVITSHVAEGLEVAKEFKLPSKIQDIIQQHHGTSLVYYFYAQASESGEPSAMLEQQFRYEGPKPKSREAAIVMLADSVEAASRGLAKPSIPTLEAMVRSIITDKLQDGQLDESELTFRDIGIIEKTFINTLTAALHARIEYNESLSADNGKSEDKDGGSDKERAEASGERTKAGMDG
jgi:putative nucleotidyltransferase with HDIG domain